jgi:hypothetical protein
MVHGVHGNTTHDRPLVALGLVLVVGTTSLQDGLVGPASTGNQADGGTVVAAEGLLSTGRQAHTGGASVSILRNNHGVVTRGLGELAAVASLGLDIADNGTLGDSAQGENVADGQSSYKIILKFLQ